VAPKKRRRPAKARTAPVAVETVAVSDATVAPPPRRRSAPPVTDPRDVPWTATGLLTLLGLAFALQIPIGVIIHVTAHTNPLIVDVFFFQPQYLVVACVLVMTLARRLTHQTRNLRLLESLSVGIMYALLSLTLGTVFVHPANAAQSTDQFIRNLSLGDGLLIALSDVIALFGTAALYPGFSRMLGAPGRRARARMVERNAGSQGSRRPGSDRAKSTPKPGR